MKRLDIENESGATAGSASDASAAQKALGHQSARWRRRKRWRRRRRRGRAGGGETRRRQERGTPRPSAAPLPQFLTVRTVVSCPPTLVSLARASIAPSSSTNWINWGNPKKTKHGNVSEAQREILLVGGLTGAAAPGMQWVVDQTQTTSGSAEVNQVSPCQPLLID